jgi:hypothetical protein
VRLLSPRKKRPDLRKHMPVILVGAFSPRFDPFYSSVVPLLLALFTGDWSR